MRVPLTAFYQESEGMKAGVAGKLDELRTVVNSLDGIVDLLENAAMKKDNSSDPADFVKTTKPVK